MKRPTTTGGNPMPVFTTLMMKARPGNRARASAVPHGTPTTSESSVAPPEIWSDRA